jgi:peptide/nickel transport system permease protein
MKMWIFIVRRLLLLIPVIIGVMTITFVLISAVPNTARCTSTFGPPPEHGGEAGIHAWYAHCVKALGLNQPAIVQWGIWMQNSLSFNWGEVNNHSFAGATAVPVAAGQPVTTVLTWFLPYTLELALLSLFIIMIIALPLGNLSAVYRNRPVDQASRVMSFSGFALPSFLLGALVLMALVLAIGPATHWHSLTCSGQALYLDFYGSWPQAGCFPGVAQFPSWLVSGQVSSPTHFPTIDAMIHGEWAIAGDTVLRMILPALVIAYGTIAILLRFVRNSMLEVLNLDFVRTARAKGLPESQVVSRHAGRNSLNVTITVLGLTFAFFLGGFPVIEDVFGLEGVGRMLAYSVIQPYDYGLIFGSTLLFTYLVVFANIIVDVLYAYLDPRVRLG